nr:reverse transcriptase domain-containing protein [Tanacetum cinerariifolium]
MSRSPKRISVFSRIQRDRSTSSRRRQGDKRRRERDVFHRLGVEEEVCPHTQKAAIKVPIHEERSRYQKVETVKGTVEVKVEKIEVKYRRRRSVSTMDMRGSRSLHPSNLLLRTLKKEPNAKQPKDNKETFEKDKPLEILMVQPWKRVARQKITQSFSQCPKILFPPLGDEDGTEGPMIIEAEIGGHFVHRIYVDGGLASEILCENCFNRLRPEVKSQMIPATTSLIGFSGEIIWPMGQILLPVKIGDAEHFTSIWMNFVVVRSPSPYNGIIGRPGSSRIIPLECTMVSGPKARPSDIIQAVEERIKVAIHPEHLEQTIIIGSTLTEEGRKALCDLLRHGLGVFAWKSADMTGVSRHIAEHILNVREGCSPVRQKKISQAPERKKLEDVREFQRPKPVEAALKEMKKLIAKLPTLTAPLEKEELIVHLAAAREAVSAVLMTEREAKKMSVYFVSRALQGPEINYMLMEKLVLALVHASKRLKRYLQAHTIIVITYQPIKQILSRPEVTGRLQK